jgi:hypothetical protein
MVVKRLFHQGLARLAARWPAQKDKLVASFNPLESTTIPWCPVDKPPERSKIALVTTAGIHHRRQRPFDMKDSEGDPSFRIIDPETIAGDYQKSQSPASNIPALAVRSPDGRARPQGTTSIRTRQGAIRAQYHRLARNDHRRGLALAPGELSENGRRQS